MSEHYITADGLIYISPEERIRLQEEDVPGLRTIQYEIFNGDSKEWKKQGDLVAGGLWFSAQTFEELAKLSKHLDRLESS